MKPEYKGELSILVSALFMGLSTVLIKMAPFSFTGIQISFARFFSGLLLGIPIALWIYKQKKLYDIKDLFLRGLTGSVAMILYYSSIRLSSSGRAYLILMTYPAFTALFGWLFFKEKISWKQIVSIILCITGAVFILNDGSTYPLLGDLLGLASAIVSGLAMHYVKKARERNNPLIAYLAACIIGIVFSTAMFPLGGMPTFTLPAVAGIMGIGAIVFVAKILEMYGFKFVSATSGSIITYASLPLVMLLSLFWVKEELHTGLYIGIGFILAGLVFNMPWGKKEAA